MKTSIIFIAVSLVLSVTAANQQQQDNRDAQNNRGGSRFQPNKGSGGNRGQRKNNNQNASNDGNNTNQSNGAAGAAGAGSANTGKVLASGNGNGAGTDNNGNASGNNDKDPQASLTLDPKVIATGFANNGQDVPTAGQVASQTSTNNFINFCLTVPNLPITNGKQITTGSCNPAPMGVIPSTENMPSSKFVFPKNGDTSIKANTAFTIQMAISNLQTGAFVNAQENYFSAPQTVNAQGNIIGHSHVVVEALTSLDQSTPTDPKKFAFFKGLNAAAVNGVLTAEVADGLPAGFYKLSSINTAANHQPVLVPIAQHGSLDDAVYFTITGNGAAAADAAAGDNAATDDGAATAAGASKDGAANSDNGKGAKGNDSSNNAKNDTAESNNNKGQQQKDQQGGRNRQQEKGQKDQQKGGRRRRYAREFF